MNYGKWVLILQCVMIVVLFLMVWLLLAPEDTDAAGIDNRLQELRDRGQIESRMNEVARFHTLQKVTARPVHLAAGALAFIPNESGYIKPADGVFTSGFGGRDIGDGAENHLGLDIANVTGTPIVAAADGVVWLARSMGGYGNVVILEHDMGGRQTMTVYGHQSRIIAQVGETVKQGQIIGLMGSTGRSTGPHVHFEIHLGTWNSVRSNAVDPWPYLNLL